MNKYKNTLAVFLFLVSLLSLFTMFDMWQIMDIICVYIPCKENINLISILLIASGLPSILLFLIKILTKVYIY